MKEPKPTPTPIPSPSEFINRSEGSENILDNDILREYRERLLGSISGKEPRSLRPDLPRIVYWSSVAGTPPASEFDEPIVDDQITKAVETIIEAQREDPIIQARTFLRNIKQYI